MAFSNGQLVNASDLNNFSVTTITTTGAATIGGALAIASTLSLNGSAGTSGYVATSAGAGSPAVWAAPATTVIRGFAAGSIGVQAQNTTGYYNESFQTATEEQAEYLIASAVTFTKLYARTAAAVGGAAQTVTITLRKNGSDTAITCSIASGAQTGNDTAHSVSYAAGDRICLKVVTSATTGNVQLQAGIAA